MQAAQLFNWSSISRVMFGHQNIRAYDSIFVVPALPKCNVYISFFLSSAGKMIFSLLNVRPHLFDSFSNIARFCSGAVFFSARLMASLTQFLSASVSVFALNVFRSNMNSGFFLSLRLSFNLPASFRWCS